MIERRQYVEGMMVVIARLTNPAYVPNANDVPSISVTQDYFSVFHATASKIGLLGELSGRVTGLYVLGKGLIEDLITLRRWHEEGIPPPRVELFELLQAVRYLFEAVRTDGAAVMAKLDEFASNRHRWLCLFP